MTDHSEPAADGIFDVFTCAEYDQVAEAMQQQQQQHDDNDYHSAIIKMLYIRTV